MASRRVGLRRKNRKSSRRRQRGGDNAATLSIAATTTASTKTIVINCILGADNKVVVTSPPAGITVSLATATNTLTFSSSTPFTNITFKGPSGPVNPRYLGVGAGIIIESGVNAIVPTGFTAVRALTATQKKLNSSSPLNGEIKIRNLNTANLGLSVTNRNFTITLTTL